MLSIPKDISAKYEFILNKREIAVSRRAEYINTNAEYFDTVSQLKALIICGNDFYFVTMISAFVLVSYESKSTQNGKNIFRRDAMAYERKTAT